MENLTSKDKEFEEIIKRFNESKKAELLVIPRQSSVAISNNLAVEKYNKSKCEDMELEHKNDLLVAKSYGFHDTFNWDDIYRLKLTIDEPADDTKIKTNGKELVIKDIEIENNNPDFLMEILRNNLINKKEMKFEKFYHENGEIFQKVKQSTYQISNFKAYNIIFCEEMLDIIVSLLNKEFILIGDVLNGINI